MEYSFVTNPSQINKTDWENFVLVHPRGNIFHTHEMVELYECADKHEPLVVACYDGSRQLVGILVAVIQKEYSGFLGKLTTRAIVWGGPLVSAEHPEITARILVEFDKLCSKKVIYSQFRNLADMGFYKKIFTDIDYKYEDHLNIHISLKNNEESLWKNIVASGRNKINKAKREGILVVLIEEKSKLNEIYLILKEVYKKIKLPLPDIPFFEKAWDIFKSQESFKCFGAYDSGKLIAVRLELTFKDVIYDWYAGSLYAYQNKFPNDILPWEILKWGSENGFGIFDFGGAGKPHVPYGVRDYKMKFGGTLVNYGRFEKIHKPVLLALAKIALKFWKLLKR